MSQDASIRAATRALEPDVWTGAADADVSGALRTKRAETHRGLRQRYIGPLQKAGYTSAIVMPYPDLIMSLQSGGVHIHPHRTKLSLGQ